jgi:hypothetical protein
MKKEEFIARSGEDAWQKMLARNRAWREEHPEQVKAINKNYKEEHPEQVIANNQELCRKGGKRYDQQLEYMRIGIQGDKNKIRGKHNKQYKPYKEIIAPDSQIHHEWIPDTAEYRGVALVEKDAHMHGFVDVIEILDGKITVLTEEEVKRKQIKKSG